MGMYISNDALWSSVNIATTYTGGINGFHTTNVNSYVRWWQVERRRQEI